VALLASFHPTDAYAGCSEQVSTATGGGTPSDIGADQKQSSSFWSWFNWNKLHDQWRQSTVQLKTQWRQLNTQIQQQRLDLQSRFRQQNLQNSLQQQLRQQQQSNLQNSLRQRNLQNSLQQQMRQQQQRQFRSIQQQPNYFSR
jgi:DNA polymerase III alpha subunit (gram-positive type)